MLLEDYRYAFVGVGVGVGANANVLACSEQHSFGKFVTVKSGELISLDSPTVGQIFILRFLSASILHFLLLPLMRFILLQ